MSDPENNLVLLELRKITKLLALNLGQSHNQTDLIKAMSKLGFQPKEIAEILGTTSNTVRVAKAQAKAKPSVKRVKGNKKQPENSGNQLTPNES